MNNKFEIHKIKLQNHRKFRLSKHTKFIAIMVVVGLILIAELSYLLLTSVNNWFKKNEFQFNKPVVVQLAWPVEVVERKLTIIQLAQEKDKLPEPKTDIEKYICQKWGVYDCKIALAVAKAEGLAYDESGAVIPDLFNINTNGSMDLGIFQINSVHYKKPQCHLADMVDPIKNVDCAYSIYEGSGWGAWSSFNNQSFNRYLPKNGI